MTGDKKIAELLNHNWNLLQNSLETLELSVNKCNQIGHKAIYSFEENESFDSLTSKFARTSDIYMQKVLRGIWSLLHEPYVPFIDLLNKVEKTGIIDSADRLLEIRELRNEIAHEYIPETLNNIVSEVITLYPHLRKNIEYTRSFISKRYAIY